MARPALTYCAVISKECLKSHLFSRSIVFLSVLFFRIIVSVITSLLVAGHHDPLCDGDAPGVSAHAGQPLIRAALSPAQIQLNFQLLLINVCNNFV